MSFDFLGNSQHPDIRNSARQALNKYGCGSCGPRGFYGTIDVHLQLEQAVSSFLGTEEAIYYSDSASCVSSAIPAFCKRGDLLIVDEACSDPIRVGARLSRSTVVTFPHNDVSELEKILSSIAADDQRLKRRPEEQRRFIVTEGVFRQTGELCPLPEILALKERFCYRLILDESLSFGSIGRTGRGLTEHFEVPISNVEVLLVALDTALGSVGGLCTGSHEVVDHQRLSGAGYCFSASAAPFLAACGFMALKRLQQGGAEVGNLHRVSARLRSGLASVAGLQLLPTHPCSPVVHLTLPDAVGRGCEEEEALLEGVAQECLRRGVGVVAVKVEESWRRSLSKKQMRPTLRLCARASLSDFEVDTAVSVVQSTVAAVL